MSRAALAQLARQLGGDVVGQQIVCPGPAHSRRDRSLSVRISAVSDDGFVVFSHAGDDFAECRDHVRALIGLGQWQPQSRDDREGVVATTPSSFRTVPRQDQTISVGDVSTSPTDDDVAKIARARAIWDEAGDPIGSLVETYLASRGLALPWETAGRALRYHPRCPWRDEASGRIIGVPAMVAAMRCVRTERFLGIHRTRLTPEGRKVDRRMLGVARGAAVHLCGMANVGAGLTLGEGIETCLAAWHLGWSNVWAACSVGAIGTFPLLPGLQSLVLLAETDRTGANARACEATGQRYADDGREVLLVEPEGGGDMNDMLLRSLAA